MMKIALRPLKVSFIDVFQSKFQLYFQHFLLSESFFADSMRRINFFTDFLIFNLRHLVIIVFASFDSYAGYFIDYVK